MTCKRHKITVKIKYTPAPFYEDKGEVRCKSVATSITVIGSAVSRNARGCKHWYCIFWE